MLREKMKMHISKQIVKNLLLIVCSLSLLGAGLAVSEEKQERKFANATTTKVKAMSQKLAKRIEPARLCLAPQPENEGDPIPEPDPQCALETLNKVRTDKLPGHEKAEIFNLLGYTYFLLENQPKTKEFYLRVVNEPEANAPLRNRTLKTVAQLHMMDEQYDQALKYYEEWMSFQEILGAPDYALLATIYYNLDDRNAALKNIEIAIEMRESAGNIGQENWYAIQRSIYYQRSDYRKVISILNKLIVNYPNVRYWRELGGMYAELEESVPQLAAYSLAYLQNGLTSESMIVGLAYMYISADAPYKAAEILIAGFESGEVEETEKNLQIVGSALYQSAELQAALPWMEKAASKATDGESYGRLAGIYVDLERFKDSIRTANEAISLGGVKRMDLVYLTKGNAEFNLKRYDDAIKSFRKIKDKRTKKSATDWILYVESEKKRDKQLRDSGIDLDKILASR